MLFNVDEAEKLCEVVNTPTRPVVYLGVDPGKSNGVCGFDAQFKLMGMWTVMENDILTFLRQFKNIKTCVIENYRLYTNKAFQQAHSDMLTSRVIGRFEAWAEINNLELIKQGANIKPIGYKFIGKKALPKSNKLNHAMDAYVHFVYWAVRKGKINAADLLNNKTPETISNADIR